MKKIIVATAALLLAACATPTPTDQTPAEEKTYVTGSRLPVKDKTSSSSTAVTVGPPPPAPKSISSPPSKTLGGG
jgi:uncharacterized lipoprotein YmbA